MSRSLLRTKCIRLRAEQEADSAIGTSDIAQGAGSVGVIFHLVVMHAVTGTLQGRIDVHPQLAAGKVMYIGELAKMTGLSIKAIRHYEDIGLIKAPARKGQYRIYDQSYVPLLGMITLAKRLGFSLLELQTIAQAKTRQGLVPIDLLQQVIGIKRASLTAQRDEINDMLAGLVQLEQSVMQHNECLLQSLQKSS